MINPHPAKRCERFSPARFRSEHSSAEQLVSQQQQQQRTGRCVTFLAVAESRSNSGRSTEQRARRCTINLAKLHAEWSVHDFVIVAHSSGKTDKATKSLPGKDGCKQRKPVEINGKWKGKDYPVRGKEFKGLLAKKVGRVKSVFTKKKPKVHLATIKAKNWTWFTVRDWSGCGMLFFLFFFPLLLRFSSARRLYGWGPTPKIVRRANAVGVEAPLQFSNCQYWISQVALRAAEQREAKKRQN